jgi:hypothetical protein
MRSSHALRICLFTVVTMSWCCATKFGFDINRRGGERGGRGHGAGETDVYLHQPRCSGITWYSQPGRDRRASAPAAMHWDNLVLSARARQTCICTSRNALGQLGALSPGETDVHLHQPQCSGTTWYSQPRGTHQIEGFPLGVHGVSVVRRQVRRYVATDAVVVVANLAVQPGIWNQNRHQCEHSACYGLRTVGCFSFRNTWRKFSPRRTCNCYLH